jgi:hypothetical protein
MGGTDIAKADEVGLNERQINALGRLHRLGSRPRIEGDPYDSDPQIRALQLVYEGKMGGKGLGQGRPRTGVDRKARAAEVIAAEIRDRFTGRMIRAIDRALKKDAGTRANLDAVKLALDIENREAALALKEYEAEFDTATKEELIAALFELVAEPQTAAAIEGTAWDITDAEVVTEEGASSAGANGDNGNTPSVDANGDHPGGAGSARGQRLARHRAASQNPFTKAALRRTKQ